MKASTRASRAAGRQVPDYGNAVYWRGTIKMSLSKFFVLSVLHRRPMHGYEVVQAVARATNGSCSPSEGTVYPVLDEVEAGGYLSTTAEVGQGLRTTPVGRHSYRDVRSRSTAVRPVTARAMRS